MLIISVWKERREYRPHHRDCVNRPELKKNLAHARQIKIVLNEILEHDRFPRK